MNREILNQKEMEELMPDYVFGKLTSDEVQAFEASLPSYPDIHQEVLRAQAVFRQAERIDINAILNQKTKNLSVKVNGRMAKKAEKRMGSVFLMRYVLPIAAVIAMVMFLISPDDKINIDTATETEIFNDDIAKAISNIDIDGILESSGVDEEFPSSSVNITGAIEDMADMENIEYFINDEYNSFFYANTLALETVKNNDAENMSPLLPASFTILNDLTNEEFLELLEVMKDEEYI